MYEKGNENKTIAQTYVWHRDNAFFVSTMNRASSAAAMCGQEFAETLVWEWHPDVGERGRLIGSDNGGKSSIHAHQKMVQRLYDTGLPDREQTFE